MRHFKNDDKILEISLTMPFDQSYESYKSDIYYVFTFLRCHKLKY
jgi:hypothetical protein